MRKMYVCHACRKEIDLGVSGTAGRRDDCPHCRAALHCCLNCHAYDESMRYGCREPQAEPPSEKERANACELFVFKKGERVARQEDPRSQALKALDALFKK
jgi:hypothetical protein